MNAWLVALYLLAALGASVIVGRMIWAMRRRRPPAAGPGGELPDPLFATRGPGPELRVEYVATGLMIGVRVAPGEQFYWAPVAIARVPSLVGQLVDYMRYQLSMEVIYLARLHVPAD